MHRARRLLLALFACIAAIGARAADVAPDPYQSKPSAAARIHVDAPGPARKPDVKQPPIGNYDPEYYFRTRLATVLVSGSRIHVDAIRDTVHFPSYHELVDGATGKLLGQFPNFEVEDPSWYFSSDGLIYLNQRHMGLCSTRYTRKFALRAGRLEEVSQPVYLLDQATRTTRQTPLYDAPDGQTVLGVVAADAEVRAVGTQFGQHGTDGAILVQSPSGLLGWHKRGTGKQDGELLLYLCN